MAKLTLNDTTSGYQSSTASNANNDLIEAAVENTLSRDGTSPNQMAADLDMNSNDILNAEQVSTQSLVLGGVPYPAGTVAVTNSDTAPANPVGGQFWWKSDVGRLYVYHTDTDSSQWVETGGYYSTTAPADAEDVPYTPGYTGTNVPGATTVEAAFDRQVDTGLTVDTTGATDHDSNSVTTPVYIHSDPASTAAGEGAGLKIAVRPNDNDGSIGVGDTIALDVYASNITSNQDIWAANFQVSQDYASGPHAKTVRGIEVGVSTIEGTAVTTPFSGANHKAIAIVGHNANDIRPTSAMTIWQNSATGTGWWYGGIDISRCFSHGLKFHVDPGGSTDDIEAFQTAAIHDASNSASVLKVDGTHSVGVLDLSDSAAANVTWLQTPDGAATTMTAKNGDNYDMDFVFDSGTSVTQDTRMAFADQGTRQWSFIKTSTNTFNIYDNVNTTTVMRFTKGSTDPVELYVGGALEQVLVGAADSGGSGYRLLRVTN